MLSKSLKKNNIHVTRNIMLTSFGSKDVNMYHKKHLYHDKVKFIMLRIDIFRFSFTN